MVWPVTMLVPVTANSPVLESNVALETVGSGTTLLVVIPLPVRSATTTAALAPAAQSSAAARLYVTAPVELVPFLFNRSATAEISAAFSNTVKLVPLVISTLVLVSV